MPFFHSAGSHLLADSKREIGLHCVLPAQRCVYAACAHIKVWGSNKAEIDAVFG